MGLLSGLKSLGRSAWRNLKQAGRDFLTEEVELSANDIKAAQLNKLYDKANPKGPGLLSRISSAVKNAKESLSSLNDTISVNDLTSNIELGLEERKNEFYKTINMFSENPIAEDEINKLFNRYNLGEGSTDSFRKRAEYAYKELNSQRYDTYKKLDKISDAVFEDKAVLRDKIDSAEKVGKSVDEDLISYDELANDVIEDNYRQKLNPQNVSEPGRYAEEWKHNQRMQDLHKFDALAEEEQAKIANQYGYDNVYDYRQSIMGNKPTISEPLQDAGTTAKEEIGSKQKTGTTPKNPSVNIDKTEYEELLDEVNGDRALEASESGKKTLEQSSGNGTSNWSYSAKLATGALVAGAGVTYALTRNRGQQSNAQLYGQQPLY